MILHDALDVSGIAIATAIASIGYCSLLSPISAPGHANNCHALPALRHATTDACRSRGAAGKSTQRSSFASSLASSSVLQSPLVPTWPQIGSVHGRCVDAAPVHAQHLHAHAYACFGLVLVPDRQAYRVFAAVVQDARRHGELDLIAHVRKELSCELRTMRVSVDNPPALLKLHASPPKLTEHIPVHV